MLFNSIEFVFFLPVVIFLYYLLPHKYRWFFLLLSSYYFYMCWKLEYIVLIIGSTVIDYLMAIMIAKSKHKIRKNIFLLLSLGANLGLLFFFKYYDFVSTSLTQAFNHFNVFVNLPEYHYLLPVGISFYTFQTLSYTIDVYRGKKEPEKHLGIFALYVSFWPQLVAGPIERSQHLLPQFYKKITFQYDNIRKGAVLVLIGFFKKVVLADRLAVIVNDVYNNPNEHFGIEVLLATYCFAFQIYCDFSGYSDIAIGSARIMGFDIMKNFRQPYFAKNIADFWRRWHISLSTWFKDYLYIPLGGNRTTYLRWVLSIITVFTISGIWHGANWTFVFWGALHGILLIILSANNHFGKLFLKIPQILQWFFTFHLVCFCWIFFRANNIHNAFILIKNIGNISTTSTLNMHPNHLVNISIIIPSLLILLVIDYIDRKDNLVEKILNQNKLKRWTIYYSLFFYILFFGFFRNPNTFIYFQF